MKLEEWTLEVIVNEEPLQEYVISDSDLEIGTIGTSNALKSYVVDEAKRKKFCESATFVAVPGPGTHYSIKVSTTVNRTAAQIFVDGINDGFFMGNRQVPAAAFAEGRTKRGFLNKNGTVIYDFIFDKTEWVELDIPQRAEFGSLGTISVQFHKIKNIYEPFRNDNSEKSFEEVKVPETKKNVDIAFTTKFSEGVELRHRPVLEVVTMEEPLAVLYINYRSVDWFTAKGIPIQVAANTSNSDEGMENVTTVNIKKEVVDDNTENKTSITQVIRKRKRKYKEIIELLDSDDEEEPTRDVVELD